MNNNEFKNFYPIEKPDNIKKAENNMQKTNSKPKRFLNIKMMNIGQLLLICFLFVVILMQTAEIISGLSTLNRNNTNNFSHTPDAVSSGANQTPNINPNKSGFNAEQNKNIENKNNSIDNIDIDNNYQNSETIFILGENNGKLAVLSPDGETVYETFDVYIDTLPDFDRDLLINGIKIKTADELQSLLEDYSS
jgi:hypothetical protein